MNEKKYRSDFLFSRPSFFGGMGSVLNIEGSYYDYNYSKSELEADNRALHNDWGVVGNDIKSIMNQCDNFRKSGKSLKDFLTLPENVR